MYWQLIVLWYLGILVTPSLTYSLQQQCVYHRTPFVTTCSVQLSPADPSSVLFPQTSDLISYSKDPSIGVYISDQQQHIPAFQDHHINDASPSSSLLPPTFNSVSATASSSPTTIPKRRVTIPSFEEWKKRIRQNEETDDNNRKPKRKPSRGTTNQGRETIDSVDGGFSDDVGSVFETGDLNGPVSTAENTYEEGVYIAPQKQQQQSNKKQFAQVPLKSLKERFNYAWTICAATVRDVNKEARGAQSILFESKDQYLLNKCAADKFVIINLCEEILIDTIVLANFEFFSSTFKDFRVYVANTYPTKEWQLLGQWQARNTRDLQVFKVQDSIGWFEYMKIEFLTHYGNEYYCPLSLLRVHGMPMMEYYNAVESQGLSGDDGETESVNSQHLWPADVRDDIIHPQLVTNTSEWFPSKGDTDVDNDDTDISGQQATMEDNGKTTSAILPADDVDEGNQQHSDTAEAVVSDGQPDLVEKPDDQPPPSTNTVEQQHDRNILNGNTSSEPNSTDISTPEKLDDNDYVEDSNGTTQMDTETRTSLPTIAVSDGASTTEGDVTNGTTLDMDVTISHSSNSITSNTSSSINWQPSSTLTVDDNSTFTSTVSLSTESQLWTSENDTTDTHIDSATATASSTAGVTSTVKTHESHTNNDDTRHKSAHSKEPTTQESIYKIIMKRLNALEVNATLSQRYLDEQNNMLNDVFGEMEKRHQDQLIFVLDRLNETASNRIDGMKRRYEQSYGELKHQMESDMREMTAKISILTDQISFEKRVSMVQLAIVVTLFVFLAISRGTMSTLSPVMIAQAEERKRRQSDVTTRNSANTQRREPSSSTLASMTKNKLDRSKLSLSSTNKIKLDMDGRKAASLDALKLHLAQQADLLPKLTSRLPSSSSQQQSLQKPPAEDSILLDSTAPGTTVKTSSTDTHRHHEQRNRKSNSLNDITNGNSTGSESTVVPTRTEKFGDTSSDSSNGKDILTDGQDASGRIYSEPDDDGDGLPIKAKNKYHRDDEGLMNDSTKESFDKSKGVSNINPLPPPTSETNIKDGKPPLPSNDDDYGFDTGGTELKLPQQDDPYTAANSNTTHT